MQTPTRSLHLQGASNFRDLGGYHGRDGRRLRWRRVFRSDHLGELTPNDLAVLSGLGLARVCDFRGQQERLAAPCVVPDALVHSLPIEPTIVQRLSDRMAEGGMLTPAETVSLMQQTYRDFVHHNTGRFADLFAHLLATDAPLVFHCTAGKDRTGFAAALLLMSLGVPRAVVMEDYLLTNTHLKMPAGAGSQLPPEVRAILYRVQADFLAAALEVVDQDHGGVDAYLAAGLGLGLAERERLGQLYLEP